VGSAEHIEVVRRFHEGWSTENWDLVLECIDPEMEFDWSESQAPFRGIYRAHDGMRKYWEDVREGKITRGKLFQSTEEALEAARDAT